MTKYLMMAMFALTATIARPAFSALPVTDGIAVHLDASDATSMTFGNGNETKTEVVEWRSVEAGGATFAAPAAIQQAGASYRTGIPYRMEDNGRQAVVFDTTSWDGVATNMFMSTYNKMGGRITGVKTVIAVTRQYVAINGSGALIGQAETSDGRFIRYSSGGTDCGWNTQYWTANRYINGVSGLTTFKDHGGTTAPHVVAATTTATAGREIDSLGGAYLCQYKEGQWVPSSTGSVYNRMSLHELVLYTRVLSAAELEQVQRYLRFKWNLDIAVWTGEGGDTDWNTAANWEGGIVPTDKKKAYFAAPTAVTASGACVAAGFEGAAVTLTLAPAASLTVSGDIRGVTFAGKGKVSCGGTLFLTGTENTFGSLGFGQVENETEEATTVILDSSAEQWVADSKFVGKINLEKRGTGVLHIGKQTYAGATSVQAGSLKAEVVIDYAKYGTVAANIDASRPDTLTLGADNRVERWDSVSANGMYFLSAEAGYADVHDGAVRGYTYYRLDGQNRPCVRFGYAADGTTVTGTLLKASSPFANGTLFCVSRQIAQLGGGTVVGKYNGYGARILRNSQNYNYQWSDENNTKGWISSIEGRNFEHAGGIDSPHVFACCRSKAETCEIIGNEWLDHTNKGMHSSLMARMDIHEIVLFEEVLTDEQIVEISKQLVKKWGCPEPEGYDYRVTNILPTGTDCTVAEGATLEFKDEACEVKSLSGSGTVKAAGDLKLGNGTAAAGTLALEVSGVIDLNGGTLCVGGFGGSGVVTNTADASATLTIVNDAAATLARTVGGNVVLEKRGTGDLLVTTNQTYSGETILAGGTLKAAVALDLGKYNKDLTFHLDASAAGTITCKDDGSGDVLRWDSLTANGVNFRSAAESYPDTTDYPFTKGFAQMVTDAHGYPCVRFGTNLVAATEKDAVASYLCAYEGDTLKATKAMTIFVVNRPLDVRYNSNAIFGMVLSAAARQMRLKNVDCQWNSSNIYRAWVSGEYQYSAKDATVGTEIEFGSSAGIEGPHVLTVVRGDKNGPISMDLDCLGACFLRQTNKDTGAYFASDPRTIGGRADIYEVIAFAKELTDAEIQEVSAYLMAKWGVVKAPGVEIDYPESPLSANTTYHVTADATLKLGGLPQTLKGFAFTADATAGFPTLAVERPYLNAFDLADMTLAIDKGEGALVGNATLLTVPFGTVENEFKSVTGDYADCLRYAPDSVLLRAKRGLLIIVQ